MLRKFEDPLNLFLVYYVCDDAVSISDQICILFHSNCIIRLYKCNVKSLYVSDNLNCKFKAIDG